MNFHTKMGNLYKNIITDEVKCVEHVNILQLMFA